jgi:4-aminobutyrate--pyruvate transaminase
VFQAASAAHAQALFLSEARMTVMPNSLGARDVAYHLHPYTNAVKHEAEGPLVLTHGKGVYVYDENGK